MPRSPSKSLRSAPGRFGAPRHARVFDRDRLFAKFDEFAIRPIIWVAGPPGSGKTTLVSSYLEAGGVSVIWVLLDRSDADPATFFHHLGLAAASATGRRRLSLPRFDADDVGRVGDFARRFFDLLFQRASPRCIVVLDDYQALDDDSPVHAALRHGLEQRAGQAQLIAISRTPPPAAFARMLSTQALGLIDSTALRFTVDETSSLLALHGRRESPERLHEAADGWVAGLILMLAAESPGAMKTDAIRADEHPTMSGTLLFDYFAGEVFDRMPQAAQRRLMRIALLPSFNVTMAVAMSEDESAAEALEDLFHRNLFVDRRGAKDPVYVLHRLFRDFLLARMRAAFDARQISELFLLAARLLANDGQVDAAMTLAFDAQAWGLAEQLLHRHAARHVALERTPAVRGWIDALPAEWQQHPMTIYWRACCSLALDPAAAGLLFSDAHAGFVDGGDPTGQLLAAAGAAESIVLLGGEQATLDRWIGHFEALAPGYFEIRDADVELRVLPGMLAAFVARRAQHRLTTILADRVEQLLDQEPVATQRILFGAVANCFIDAGLHERVGRIVARIERLRNAPHIAPVVALRWLQVEILWKSLVGRVDGLLDDADEALRLTRLPGLEKMQPFARIAAAHAAWVAGDTARAHGHIEIARTLIQPTRLYERSILEFLTGVVALREGDPAIGVQKLQGAARLAREAGCPGRERVAQFALCLAHTEAGELASAQAALVAARSDPSYGVSPFHQWVIAIIGANLANRLGDLPGCKRALGNGFSIARENGYTFAPGLFSTGIMPRMCAIALANDIDVTFVRDLIRLRQLPAPPDAPSTWPWPVRIHTLGRFLIERDDASLPLSRKEQKKPLELLRLLIAHGGVGVNARRVASLLWPDADGAAAQNSFDNALHRLRKLLGDERGITLHNGNLGIDPTLCWVDVQALEACVSRTDALLRDAADDDPSDRRRDLDVELASIATRMLALYEGPFLEGDDGFAIHALVRERLRGRYLRTLTSIAARDEAHGHPQGAIELYRRILEQDPLAEAVSRSLIRCFLSLGLRAEAFDVYRRCRDNLSIMLGVKPTVETERLVERLRAE